MKDAFIKQGCKLIYNYTNFASQSKILGRAGETRWGSINRILPRKTPNPFWGNSSNLHYYQRKKYIQHTFFFSQYPLPRIQYVSLLTASVITFLLPLSVCRGSPCFHKESLIFLCLPSFFTLHDFLPHSVTFHIHHFPFGQSDENHPRKKISELQNTSLMGREKSRILFSCFPTAPISPRRNRRNIDCTSPSKQKPVGSYNLQQHFAFVTHGFTLTRVAIGNSFRFSAFSTHRSERTPRIRDFHRKGGRFSTIFCVAQRNEPRRETKWKNRRTVSSESCVPL